MQSLSEARPRVLYIVYWGAAEPLGQSLVLPAVTRLAELGAELTLVTFEKTADLEREDQMAKIRSTLEQQGIRWIPLQYHKSPKIPATAFDILHGCGRAIVERLQVRPDVIHARTFIGGLIGMVIAPVLGAKLIYHAEGFYPDEEVDGGVWQAGSMPHRLAKFLERRMYSRADGVIVLTQRARAIIEKAGEVGGRNTPVMVVPSCVNLELFNPERFKPRSEHSTLRFVYVGTVGKRYLLEQAASFVAVAAREFGDAQLRVLTREDPGLVASMLRRGGLKDESWSLEKLPYSSMPEELADQDVGLFFLSRGLSEHGCSPTKIGEYWAMGLPVATTPNVSDTDELIRRERVGVIVNGHSDEDYRQAAFELRLLLQDPDLAARCRRAAEAHYALEPACQRQVGLYRELALTSARKQPVTSASEFSNL